MSLNATPPDNLAATGLIRPARQLLYVTGRGESHDGRVHRRTDIGPRVGPRDNRSVARNRRWGARGRTLNQRIKSSLVRCSGFFMWANVPDVSRRSLVLLG